MSRDHAPTKDPAEGALPARLWRYQAERFPLANHGVLTLAFSASACAFAAALTEPGRWPSGVAVALATIAGLCQFALLRIADEHKDFDTDAKHRPYRAVPRGLVTLAELRGVGFVAAAIMIATIALAGSGGVALLALALWTYFGLMTAEFFIGETLKRMPITYLLSHMVLTPLLAWLLASFQLASDGLPIIALPERAPAYLACIFALGIVLELGRKIRATSDEEQGVETYSALWGPARASDMWLAAIAIAALTMIAAVAAVRGSLTVATVLAALGVAAAVFGLRRFAPATAGSGKRIEQASSLFALALLLALGVAPHIEALP